MSTRATLSSQALGRIALLGGVGGAINAWLCYAKLPGCSVPEMDFIWAILPAGALHGGLLAVIPVWAAWLLREQRMRPRLAALPLAGWVSGWIPYIPISFYVGLYFAPDFGGGGWYDKLLKAFWPFRMDVESLWMPWQSFGFVGAAYYLLLNLCRGLTSRSLFRHLLMGILSGALGSLWWWSTFKPWYLSVVHGAIWGSLVGFGVWKSQQQPAVSRR